MIEKTDFICETKEIAFELSNQFVSLVKNWYGRSVRLLQGFKQVNYPIGSALTIIAANMVVFQIAFRIANLLGEKNYILKIKPGKYEGFLGPVFAVLYGVGIFVVCKTISTSLDPISCIAMHGIGLVLSAVLTEAIDG